MSQETKLDPRKIRTRRLLETSLLALLEEQEITDITVGEIARRAGVNRNTFYLHYRDKDDLLAQTLEDLFEELTAPSREFVEAHEVLRPDVVPAATLGLFSRLGQHPALYHRLIGEAGATPFADRLRTFHEQQFLRLWKELGLVATAGSPPPEMRARCCATLVEGAIGWWLGAGQGPPAEDAARYTWQMLRPLWFEATRRE